MTAEQPARAAPDAYPARLDIDYPETLSRATTAFRLFMLIPILILLVAITGATSGATAAEGSTDGAQVTSNSLVIGGVGVLFFGPLLMILFRQKYPGWWFDWNRAMTRFQNRVFSYALLLRDEYPSTDEEQAVHLELDYPDAERDLNRWLPLVKWLLAIPHYIVLLVLWLGVSIVVVIAWFAILFTGRYPRDLFNFVVGVQRWTLRVQAYALLLVTDRYPPFRLGP